MYFRKLRNNIKIPKNNPKKTVDLLLFYGSLESDFISFNKHDFIEDFKVSI